MIFSLVAAYKVQRSSNTRQGPPCSYQRVKSSALHQNQTVKKELCPSLSILFNQKTPTIVVKRPSPGAPMLLHTVHGFSHTRCLDLLATVDKRRKSYLIRAFWPDLLPPIIGFGAGLQAGLLSGAGRTLTISASLSSADDSYSLSVSALA